MDECGEIDLETGFLHLHVQLLHVSQEKNETDFVVAVTHLDFLLGEESEVADHLLLEVVLLVLSVEVLVANQVPLCQDTVPDIEEGGEDVLDVEFHNGLFTLDFSEQELHIGHHDFGLGLSVLQSDDRDPVELDSDEDRSEGISVFILSFVPFSVILVCPVVKCDARIDQTHHVLVALVPEEDEKRIELNLNFDGRVHVEVVRVELHALEKLLGKVDVPQILTLHHVEEELHFLNLLQHVDLHLHGDLRNELLLGALLVEN